MSISIANAASIAYSEAARSTSLFPGYVHENSEAKIIQLIRDYYRYLNSNDAPSFAIQNLVLEHDIDEMSDKYLTAIQLQIAKSVPNSIALDKRRLFKVIAQYYKTRGSEESIHIFFRIFFNELVTIFYPSSQLFHSSDDQSESSTIFRLQDGERWQKYSYEIRSINDSSLWKESFLKFIHPAGLKLLIAVIILCVVEQNWEGPLGDFIPNYEDISVDDYWNNIRVDSLIGSPSPKWQPNTAVILDYLFKSIIDSTYSYRTQTYSVRGIGDDALYASVLNILLELTSFAYGSSLGFRSEYQTWLKYSDTVKIADGYANITINDASNSYLPMNECRFEAVTSKIDLSDDYVSGYINTVNRNSELNWNIEASVEELPYEDLADMYNYTAASGTLHYLSIEGLTNSIIIDALTLGPAGNLITVNLMSLNDSVIPNEVGGLVNISIFQNIITITPMTGAKASHIVTALNEYAAALITATQVTSDYDDVPTSMTPTIISTVTLTGGTRTVNPVIEMKRKHRYGYIPEADEIIF